MAKITEVRKASIGNAGVTITIDAVDNHAIVALNGVQLKELKGPPGFQTYSENITTKLEDDRPNVLVVTLANLHGSGFNPANISGKVDIGSEEVNISETSGNQSVAQGIFSQTMLIIEK